MINIDLTTKNNIYNTVGPQAQWIQHRFGRRNYPDIELNTDIILNAISKLTETINFISVFGDTCLHPDFIEILSKTETGKSIVNTSLNFNNDNIIDALNNKRSFVVVPLFGINELCDKIVLGADWNLISDNLKKLSCGVQIEFYTYNHNIQQLAEITDFCNSIKCNLKINKGVSVHPDGFSPIVDSEGNWLYDVYVANEETDIRTGNLYKTVPGYNSLVQFVKPLKGRSILNNPTVYKFINDYTYDKDISISVTGDVFPSFALHQIFSNTLCTDWNLSVTNVTSLDKTSIREEFKYTLSALNKILLYLNEKNNIYNKDILDILTDLTNSDI